MSAAAVAGAGAGEGAGAGAGAGEGADAGAGAGAGRQQQPLYPACDASVWLRSCEQEVPDPLPPSKFTGQVPAWLRGALLRNGPGSLHAGGPRSPASRRRLGDSDRVDHLFDSAALLHRFSVGPGGVTYQCRFLRSEALRRNRAARRVVLAEFGTRAAPDPCRTIFDRVSALFRPDEAMSDNAMISLYPFGDELYAFTEAPVIHRVDPATLATGPRRSMLQSAALVNHTSHPHVMPNGDVYNVGMTVSRGRVRHVVVHFPCPTEIDTNAGAGAAAEGGGGDMFAAARVVARMRPRWPLHPAYMHSFGVTEHYWVLVEQPLALSLPRLLRAQLGRDALRPSLRWYQDQETHVVLLSRADGRECARFRAAPLFFLHVVNAHEAGGEVRLDLCAYRDAHALDAMYVRAMEDMQSNPDYAEWFRARPVRLRLPLAPAGAAGAARARLVHATPLADVGCETPRINYNFNGRPYRYFYAISSDVDAENPGTLVKVDTRSGAVRRWSERGVYPSEPVFVPRPGAQEEDDGVVLSALVWSAAEGEGAARRTALLVLCAARWRELARAVFQLPSPAPKCLHGWFLNHPGPDRSP